MTRPRKASTDAIRLDKLLDEVFAGWLSGVVKVEVFIRLDNTERVWIWGHFYQEIFPVQVGFSDDRELGHISTMPPWGEGLAV